MPALPWGLALFCPLNAPKAIDRIFAIEPGGAPFEQAIAWLRDPECVIEVRPARRAPRPSGAERDEQRHTDTKNAL
jgi:hypothetical protein